MSVECSAIGTVNYFIFEIRNTYVNHKAIFYKLCCKPSVKNQNLYGEKEAASTENIIYVEFVH